MLVATQTSKPFTPWEEDCPQSKAEQAHSANVNTYRDSNSFEQDIEAYVLKNSDAVPYDAIEYKNQRKFVRSTFYRKHTNSRAILWRVYADGSQDDEMQMTQIKSAIRDKFKHKVQPLMLDDDNLYYYIRSVVGLRYNPETNEQFFKKEYSLFKNTFRPFPMKKTATVTELPDMMKQYLDRLMPPEHTCTNSQGVVLKQQDFLMAYMAQRLQRQAEPPEIGIILRGEEGTGKGIWMDLILKPAMGNNYLSVKVEDIMSRFNSNVFTKTLVQIEELEKAGPKAPAVLKRLITQDEALIELKGVEARRQRKFLSVVCSSNKETPMPIGHTDRRWFIPWFSTHAVSPAESKVWFTKTFAPWIKEPENLQEVINYLYSLDIRSISFNDPPMTDDKELLMETVSAPKDNRIVASMQIEAVYKDYVFALGVVKAEWKMTQGNARQALLDAGFVKYRRRWATNTIDLYIHQSLLPDDPNKTDSWDDISYNIFTKRDYKLENPTNREEHYDV